ncbi:two-component sensor histidine kinase [Virgisporangium aliadipatigenens]|uniref:histidine kinase n=1 Tax=Virgisporangium aliadipatigenens TaxID=741659 RepID=A0A8J4DRN6_9ACTN|nr:two-component sensor histidine kinase [Virgisporangium aliadipatigenens]
MSRIAARARASAGLSWLFWWLGTGLVAVALLPLNIALPADSFDVPPLIAFVAGVGQSTGLVLALVRPRAATAVQFVAVGVLAMALPDDSGSTWPLTPAAMITLIAHIALLAARTPWPAVLTAWWGSGLLLVVVVLLDPRGRSATAALGNMIFYSIASSIVLGAVLVNRRWREVRRELVAARRDVALEQSQRAVAEERTRIARELHDVVAHSMSVIHMQATSASYRIKDLDPAAEAEFARIAAGARGTLREMRQLLAVLRDENTGPDLAPVPDLSGLPALVESARRAGVPVSLDAPPGEFAIPESVALAAYRIVQESLSNVIRHAPGAHTSVRLELEEDLLVVIENGAAARPERPMEEPGRARHGLAGMRERARLAGGTLTAGTRAEGGYRVAARLPIGGTA